MWSAVIPARVTLKKKKNLTISGIEILLPLYQIKEITFIWEVVQVNSYTKWMLESTHNSLDMHHLNPYFQVLYPSQASKRPFIESISCGKTSIL